MVYPEFWSRYLSAAIYRPLVLGGVLVQVFTGAFFICALVVASIDNAGFDVVLTGLILCVWELGAMWLLKKGPHETSLGFLIGVTIVLNMITLMTAIYWGQLANCETEYDGDYDQYSCSNRSAMRGVAAFASIIWVLQLPFIFILIQRRGVLTREDFDAGAGGSYGDYGDGAYDRWVRPPADEHLGAAEGLGATVTPVPETSDL